MKAYTDLQKRLTFSYLPNTTPVLGTLGRQRNAEALRFAHEAVFDGDCEATSAPLGSRRGHISFRD
jgi:hypothetical protein